MAEERRHRVIVRSMQADGFFRAGRRWSPDPVEVIVSEAELAVLEREPRLSVQRLGPVSRKAPASDG